MSSDYERGVEQASEVYKGVIREYVAENDKLRKLVSRADTLMQGVLDNATDTVVVSDLPCCDTLFDNLCDYRLKMLKLGFELSDARIRELRELGIEVSK